MGIEQFIAYLDQLAKDHYESGTTNTGDDYAVMRDILKEIKKNPVNVEIIEKVLSQHDL